MIRCEHQHASFSPDGSEVQYLRDGAIHARRVPAPGDDRPGADLGPEVERLRLPGAGILAFAQAPGDAAWIVVTAGSAGVAGLASQAQGLRPFADCAANEADIEISRDGRLAAVGCWWGADLRIFDVATGRTIALDDAPDGAARAAFSPDGTRVVVSALHRIAVWSTESGRRLVATDHDPGVWCEVAWSADGSVIAAHRGYGAVHLLEAATLAPIARLEAPESCDAIPLAISQDGTLVLDGTADRVRIWDLPLLRRHLGKMGMAW